MRLFPDWPIRKCGKCEALQDEVAHLRGLIDRLMVQTWPKVETGTAEPKPEIEEDTRVAERITFGEG